MLVLNFEGFSTNKGFFCDVVKLQDRHTTPIKTIFFWYILSFPVILCLLCILSFCSCSDLLVPGLTCSCLFVSLINSIRFCQLLLFSPFLDLLSSSVFLLKYFTIHYVRESQTVLLILRYRCLFIFGTMKLLWK